MATEEDLKKASPEEDSSNPEEESEGEGASSPTEGDKDDKIEIRAKTESVPIGDAEREAAEVGEAELNVPVQLGYQRYVYAAYMAFALLAGFLLAKIGHAGWYRLGQWKPELGEPRDELVYPVAGGVGIFVAYYYWRKESARKYVMEVAEELSKVTWPSRKEVTNSTTVVVLTTLFATVFFALMDRFWGFITDKIYTF